MRPKQIENGKADADGIECPAFPARRLALVGAHTIAVIHGTGGALATARSTSINEPLPSLCESLHPESSARRSEVKEGMGSCVWSTVCRGTSLCCIQRSRMATVLAAHWAARRGTVYIHSGVSFVTGPWRAYGLRVVVPRCTIGFRSY